MSALPCTFNTGAFCPLLSTTNGGARLIFILTIGLNGHVQNWVISSGLAFYANGVSKAPYFLFVVSVRAFITLATVPEIPQELARDVLH